MFNTIIATIVLRESVNTSATAGLLVSSYIAFAKTLGFNQTVHVYVHKEVDIPLRTMMSIYAAVRNIKHVHASVTHMILHIANDFTVRCCNQLFAIFPPSIKVSLEAWNS